MVAAEGHCEELHMWLSDNKKQLPRQRVVYTGIILDTIQGRYFCPEEKRGAIVSVLRGMCEAGRMGAREVAGVRGKVGHYSICLPYLKVYAPWFSQIIKTEGEAVGWDEVVRLPTDTVEVCSEIIEIIGRTHQDGIPLWPYVASSLHGQISRGDFGGGRGRLRITHDASFEGWAAMIEWSGNKRVVVATFGAAERSDFQV